MAGGCNARAPYPPRQWSSGEVETWVVACSCELWRLRLRRRRLKGEGPYGTVSCEGLLEGHLRGLLEGKQTPLPLLRSYERHFIQYQ